MRQYAIVSLGRVEALLVLVDRGELVAAAEGAVLVGGARPRDVARAGDVAGPERALVGVARHVRHLADVLLRAADVHHRAAGLHVREDLGLEGADRRGPARRRCTRCSRSAGRRA